MIIYYFLCLILLLVSKISTPLQSNLQIEKCNNTQYFDIITLSCLNCPFNQVSYKKDPFSCDCKPGFYAKWAEPTGRKECYRCPEGHASSCDKFQCIDTNNQTNQTLHLCKNCPPNMIATDLCANKTCARSMCTEYQINYFSNECSNCIPCYTGCCICPNSTHTLLEGICISLINLSSNDIFKRTKKFTIQFRSKERESLLLHKYFRMSSYSCNYLQNATSCQLLANLCVLLYHSFDFGNACDQYWDKIPFGEVQNLPAHRPHLYFDKNMPSNEVLKNSSFKAKISLKNDNKSNFNLTVAKYSLTGNLLAFDSAENVFHICPELISKLKRLKAGDVFESKCKLSVKDIEQYSNLEFYDVYFNYFDNGHSKMVPLPILNLNYKFDGSRININEGNKLQLTQRFFLIDTITGEHPNKEENLPTKYCVRFIQSAELWIQLQRESAQGYIYTPYLSIQYREETLQELHSKSYVEISLKVKYFIDSKKPNKIISITMAIACTFSVILALIKTWSISTRCGKQNLDITTVLHLICLICGYIANCFYFGIFFICCVWVFIFRFQDVVWLFLPYEEQEFIFKQYLISAFSLKIVHLAYIIFIQITIDLFFIDWEQPKSYHTNYSLNYKVESKKERLSVSIWRTYFIANEWNELQTYRKVNLSLVLFGLIFLLNVMGYENLTRLTISYNFDTKDIPFSLVARFAISIFFFLLISFAQELFIVIIYERYIENKLQIFVDLCSMANISVLIFKFSLHGYYIHGKSVYGEADLDMKSLFDNMKREEGDLFPKRGLEPSSECQTFEVRVTSKFRLNYNSILETFDDTANSHSRNHKSTNRKKTEHCIKAHEQMKAFLNIFLQHGLKELDYTIKEKLFLENFLDLEFQEPQEKSLFFRDYHHSFDKVLFHGEEGVLLTFEMMMFTFVDVFTNDFILASIITYLVHKLIYIIRYEGGKRNMIYKTLVDERFLI